MSKSKLKFINENASFSEYEQQREMELEEMTKILKNSESLPLKDWLKIQKQLSLRFLQLVKAHKNE